MLSFEPNYTILTFLMIKTFFFVEVIGALGLIRALSAARLSRVFAVLTVLLSLVVIAAKYVPALAGWTGTEAGRVASGIVNAGVLHSGSGMAAPIAASALFALSAISPGRRWWALDVLFVIACAGFFGLWVYTLL